MTHSVSASPASGSWPWPPEVPRRPDQPPYYPPQVPREPTPPKPSAPPPILPSWEEPDPDWADRRLLELLLEQRVITLTGRIDSPTTERVSAQLLLLDRTDPNRPIEIHLTCRDADLEASVALAAAADLCRAPIHAVVTGTVTGPALAVLCAARERTAHRHATFVLTLPRGVVEEAPPTIATQAEEHQRRLDQLVVRIATATGQDRALVEADLRAGRVLSADEARSYGLVSAVV